MSSRKDGPSYKRLGVSREQLADLYCSKQMSQKEIAALLGCTQSAVHFQLRKHGIQSRSLSQAQELRNDKTTPARGPSHPLFKTGINDRGYCKVKIEGVTKAAHRLAAEQVLGRKLSRQEAVHHANGIKSDNRPENLWVFPTNIDHRAYHDHGTVHPATIFLVDFPSKKEL